MKRLLIIGSSSPESLESYYAEAFRSLGVEVTSFDPDRAPVVVAMRANGTFNRLTWGVQHLWVGKSLTSFISEAPPTDAVLVFKGQFRPAAAVRAAREKLAVPWFNLNPDSPFDPGRSTSSRHIRESLGLYDAYLIWSRALVSRLEHAGCRRVIYVPFGYHAKEHFPSESVDLSLANTLTFVGSYDLERARMLEAIADLPLRIFGGNWERLQQRSPLRSKVVRKQLHRADLRRVVTSSLANINILRPQNAGAHNMRTFEVPAMGGIMVTTRTPEQHEVFPEGEASLAFDGAHELRRVVESLLNGAIETKNMRRRALELSQAHSYQQRAEVILELFH
jgi:hypothetical protein